jgi:hypothetical protein
MTDEELASYIASPQAGPVPYKAHELLLGIQAERERLLGGQYVVVVSQQFFDFEGMHEELFLECSRPSRAQAEAAAIDLARALLAQQLDRPVWEAEKWVVESEGLAPYASRPRHESHAVITFERSFKLRASAYDTSYTIVRSIGPCGHQPIDKQLVDTINSRAELWRYFVEVGERELNPFRSHLRHDGP